ncbi:MAG: hypothetical protein WDM90_21155 [Ferruginibacter sp.]
MNLRSKTGWNRGAIKDRIQASEELLKSKNILLKNKRNKNNRTISQVNNDNWRFWMAGELFK